MLPRGCAAAAVDDDARLRLTRYVRQGTRAIRAGAWATAYMEGGRAGCWMGERASGKAKADDDAHVALAACDDTALRSELTLFGARICEGVVPGTRKLVVERPWR